MGRNYKQNALTVTAKAYCRGTTLLEACLAFSLVMVSVVGCLTTFQMAIKLRNSVEMKSRALTEAQGLADAVARTLSGHALDLLLTDEKARLEDAFPRSDLSWKKESVKQVYQLCFLWKLRDTHQIEFIAMPRDFH